MEKHLSTHLTVALCSVLCSLVWSRTTTPRASSSTTGQPPTWLVMILPWGLWIRGLWSYSDRPGACCPAPDPWHLEAGSATLKEVDGGSVALPFRSRTAPSAPTSASPGACSARKQGNHAQLPSKGRFYSLLPCRVSRSKSISVLFGFMQLLSISYFFSFCIIYYSIRTRSRLSLHHI